MSRFVTVQQASKETGYSVGAIYKKIERNVWIENAVWIRAPDGRPLIDIEGYELWVKGKELELRQRAASR